MSFSFGMLAWYDTIHEYDTLHYNSVVFCVVDLLAIVSTLQSIMHKHFVSYLAQDQKGLNECTRTSMKSSFGNIRCLCFINIAKWSHHNITMMLQLFLILLCMQSLQIQHVTNFFFVINYKKVKIGIFIYWWTLDWIHLTMKYM